MAAAGAVFINIQRTAWLLLGREQVYDTTRLLSLCSFERRRRRLSPRVSDDSHPHPPPIPITPLLNALLTPSHNFTNKRTVRKMIFALFSLLVLLFFAR